MVQQTTKGAPTPPGAPWRECRASTARARGNMGGGYLLRCAADHPLFRFWSIVMSDLILQSHRTIVLEDGSSWYFGAGAKGKPHMRSADWSAVVMFGDIAFDVAALPSWNGAGASSMPGYASNVQQKVNRIWHNRCKDIVPDISMQEAIDRLIALVAEANAEKAAKEAAKEAKEEPKADAAM